MTARLEVDADFRAARIVVIEQSLSRMKASTATIRSRLVAAGRGRLGAWAIGMSGLRGNWITAMGSYTTQVSALPSVRFDTTWHGAEMEVGRRAL